MTVPVLTIDAVDVTDDVYGKTLHFSLNTLDVTLVDPAAVPALGDTVDVDAPSWEGTVASVTVTDNDLGGHKWVRITATNTDEAVASPAPIDIVDTDNDYRNLEVTRTLHNEVEEIRGTFETFLTGLLPGHTFELTSATHGFSASEFGITDVKVNWLRDDTPVFKVSFGDAIVDMSVWVNSAVDPDVIADGILPISGTDIVELSIDGTRITDGAVSTPKLAAEAVTANEIAAGAVTANKLAAELVLASLIATPDTTGRRVELDPAGIRLYDSDESLLVRVPTNGDPVYVKGEVRADSLVSESTAELREVVSLAGDAVMTLQNGISDPTNPPTVTASVDYLTLGSTPAGTPTGIGYDSGAGTFWIAADPTSGYVAHEYNATTGAFVRSIAATGSTETITATVGSTSHISDTAQSKVGTTDTHITSPVTIPSGLSTVRATKVSVYAAGVSGGCDMRVGLWSTGGTCKGRSSQFTATSRTFSAGSSDQYNKTLSEEPGQNLGLVAGTTYRIGFMRTNTSDTSQFDRDDGSGKTTYSADGTTADGTGWGTLNSASKINTYLTYTYEVDTRLETAPMIGVATDGTYVYTLDDTGVIWKYNRSTGAYDSNSAVITTTGTKSNAGLFYDATAARLIITTTTGTGAGVYPKFYRVTPSTLTADGTVYSASAGTTFSGTTDTFRGGARLNDPLNGNTATYWIPVVNTVYAYTFSGSTATQTSDRTFGHTSTISDGLTHDGTQFRGYDNATPTRLHKFTNWDWTTASAIYWFAYSWYDSAGTTHETAVSPRTSLTLRRRERVQVQNAAIPIGGADDPDKVRIYFKPNATDPGAGNFNLQVTDALTSRMFTDYSSGGAADSTTNTFGAGTAAEIRSAIAVASGGWSLKGDGTFQYRQGTAFPGSPATNDRFYRTDLRMSFFYDGTRWLSNELFTIDYPQVDNISATRTDVDRIPTPLFLGGSNIWMEKFIVSGFHVASGGTALSGSHKWDIAAKVIDTSGSFTTLGTYTINSGSSGAWRTGGSTTINALLGTDKPMASLALTKTGTPGNLYAYSFLTYRIVAT